MPGPKMPRPKSATAPSTVDRACSMVMSPPANELAKLEKSVEPMPTMTASTISLIPAAMTLPSTRSARNAVFPHSANGTRIKPASVVSLNSRIVMKSWMLSTKNARSTIAQAIRSTAIWVKFSKKAMGPSRSWISARSGCAAS
jgi:hypothetical protein